tara:strand:+ start:576 stop:797 length:222 start_codon:yes stop_codon:yes gene_type:complete
MDNLTDNTVQFLQVLEDLISEGMLLLRDKDGGLETKETLNLLMTCSALRALHSIRAIQERPESQVIMAEAGEA